MPDKITVGKLIGQTFEDDFESFDLTEIQKVLSALSTDNALDIAHSEMLQQKTLYAADLMIEYMAKLIKMVSYLESKISSLKNKAALAYKAPDGRTTADMKKQAGESDPEVEELASSLARAKGAKLLLDRKYEIIIKSHHFFKDLAGNQKKGIVETSPSRSYDKSAGDDRIIGETNW
jgi:hypothetical protein